LADARRRRFDAVAVTKSDRLARSLHHLLTLLGEFEALGIDLVSLDDGFNRSTPVGRLFFQIRGAFAEYERRLIRERVSAGMQAARRRGSKIGRPKVVSREKSERLGLSRAVA
jgi:DNA invertase Pin-like site-specific DNA recombinase